MEDPNDSKNPGLPDGDNPPGMPLPAGPETPDSQAAPLATAAEKAMAAVPGAKSSVAPDAAAAPALPDPDDAAPVPKSFRAFYAKVDEEKNAAGVKPAPPKPALISETHPYFDVRRIKKYKGRKLADPANPVSVKKLLALDDVTPATPDEIEALKAAQLEYERMTAMMDAHNNDAASKKLRGLHQAYRENPTQENLDAINNLNGTWSHLNLQNQEIRNTIRMAMREHDEKVVAPLVAVICQRAADLLEPVAELLEEKERDVHEHFGISNYVPSAALNAVCFAIATLISRVERPFPQMVIAASPRAQLADILDFEPGEK